MFRLPASWVWDFWFADDGERYHLFFLKASRALIDPDRRHLRATVGHAISTDLTNWVECTDALVPSDGPAFDDLAIWTGCVLRGSDGRWRMFYTGVDRSGKGLVQRIGGAVSTDLYEWNRVDTQPLITADDRWYERIEEGQWPDEAWRDPWVFRDPYGNGWHMLVTARANIGAAHQRGVIGHATSTDLGTWRVESPLSAPGAGFGQLEVLQVADPEGRPVLIFSCMTSELACDRRHRGETGGIWAVNLDKATGPYDVGSAYKLTDENLYVGRLIQDRSNQWVMLAFHNLSPDGRFVGEIVDPISLRWAEDGRLRLHASN